MISTGYIRTMTAYNTVMNERLYAASARLSDAERSADRGAFWTSIHGTLSHLLWADTMWMSRFDGWQPARRPLAESHLEYPVFAEMRTARIEADRRLTIWAADLEPGWLDENQTWYSGAAEREMTAPRTALVLHLFNHQTHHRGQVHAMLTAAGQETGPTDLSLVLSPTELEAALAPEMPLGGDQRR